VGHRSHIFTLLPLISRLIIFSFYKFSELKNVKKAIDDKDRARKASVLNVVADTAKSILQANPGLPFLVYDFNAYAQNKALDGALKQVSK
jgi:hypothetical protein